MSGGLLYGLKSSFMEEWSHLAVCERITARIRSEMRQSNVDSISLHLQLVI